MPTYFQNLSKRTRAILWEGIPRGLFLLQNNGRNFSLCWEKRKFVMADTEIEIKRQ